MTVVDGDGGGGVDVSGFIEDLRSVDPYFRKRGENEPGYNITLLLNITIWFYNALGVKHRYKGCRFDVSTKRPMVMSS